MKKIAIRNLIIIVLVSVLTILDVLIVGIKGVKAAQEENGQEYEETSQNQELEVILDQKIKKYFELENGQKLLEQEINVSLNQENQIKENEKIEVVAPTIQNQIPEIAIVILNGVKLDSATYNYDAKKGTLEINISKDLALTNFGNQTEKYQVIFGYNEIEVKETENIELNTKVFEKVENKEEITKEDKRAIELKPQGESVSIEARITKEIYKGYMYQGTQKETPYMEEYNIEVSNMQDVNELTITNEKEVYTKSENEEKIENEARNIIIKSTSINKEDFLRILGEEGKIKIEIPNLDNNETLEITKDTKENEQGNIVITYPENTLDKIKITTTKPKEEGTLTLTNEKAIKPETTYTKEELKTFENLETTIKANNSNANLQMKLLDTSYASQIEVNQKNLSTTSLNKDVEIRAILKASNQTMELYENPIVKITFPEEIEEINVKEINLLYEDELKISNAYSKGNDIFVELSGKQTKYKEEALEGAIITIKADLNLNKKVTNRTRNISMEVTTQNNVIQNSQEEINVVSPREIITVNSVEEYGVETVGEEKTQDVELERRAESKELTIKSQIINNNGSKINDVKILGDIPTNGEVKIEDTKYLNNLNATLVANIETVGKEVEIYYTENKSATENIDEASNGWTKDAQSLTNINKYLIIINEMEKDESLEFSYKVSIPENLEYNMQGILGYTVYYTNSDTQVSNQIKSTYLNLTTGQGPILEGNLKAYVGGKEISKEEKVKAGEVIEYKVDIVNSGTKEATNVKVKGNVPNNTTYVDDETLNQVEQVIEEIKPGETKTISYKVQVNKDLANEETIANVVTIIYDENSKDTNEISTIIAPGELSISLNLKVSEETVLLMGETVEYTARIENNTNVAQKNVELEWDIDDIDVITSQRLIRSGIEEDVGEAIDTTKNVIIDEIPANQTVIVSITILIGDNGEVNRDLIVSATLKNGENIYRADPNSRLIYSMKNYTISMSANNENGYMKAGDEINYKISITNNNILDSSFIFYDEIPSSLTINSVMLDDITLENNEENEENIEEGNDYKIEINENKVTVTGMINSSETRTITINTVINYMENQTQTYEIRNKAQLDVDLAEMIESNEVVHYVEKTTNPDDPGNPDDPNNPEETTYRISGRVWQDLNSDGELRNESGLAGIKVNLVNITNNNIVTNKDGNNITAVTNGDGAYTLTNIPKGQYLVVFEYDNKLYKLTSYKQAGIDDSRNSKAIAKRMTINGKETIYGVTDVITINDRSIANINMGLIKTDEFDLKLDKYVSRIILQDQKSSNVYSYNKQNLAKVEIDAKKINNTQIIVEYEIDITNIGELDGYVRKVYDYIPEGFTLDTDSSKDWYMQNGVLVNETLANQEIKVGETKTLTLRLVKQMNEDTLGTYTNIAEIAEDYNEQGVEDINSTPANRSQGENDMSQAEVLISIRTGKAIIYISLVLSIIIIIGVGIYFIKKKVI